MRDFIELIKENASKYPNRVAVIDKERRFSYSDFITLVNSISNYLITINSKPKIVFDLSQGTEAYALIIAVFNVGGTFCPINPEAPIERKLQIIKEFEPDLIVVDSDEKITNLNAENVLDISDLYSVVNTSEVNIDYHAEDIIYIIYTSGSTGISKGVKICRKSLNKFLEWSIPTYAANENDIWGQFSFLSFDLSIVDIFTCLGSGATLYAMNDLLAKKYRPAGEIENRKITIWHSIPSAIEFLINNEKSKAYDFSSLRLMSFCGESLHKHQVEFLFNKKPDLIIFNTYGPTEGTLFCTWQELKSVNYQKYLNYTLSIGKPIPGWNIKLNPVEGFDGKEIILYGDYIGKGYLGFVRDSKFKNIETEKGSLETFETGDIANEVNGNLFFSCRIDRQIKIKGFRIELDEIDLRLREFLNLPCLTVLKNERLYSFIETHEKVNENELREFLKTKLELYKIPNAFYSIQEIPRNQNQKIDVKFLLEKIL